MNLIFTDGNDSRFVKLCYELDACLNEIVGGEKQREQYTQYNTLEDIHHVVLILENEEAVACGSFKEYSEKVAEIKRLFVRESYRGRGLSKSILNALEKEAKEKGYTQFILETGKLLEAATNLYINYGFTVINNYGPYVHMSNSLCMEKLL